MKRPEMRSVGKMMGCRIWVELDSAHDDERDHRFRMVEAVFREQFFSLTRFCSKKDFELKAEEARQENKT